MKNCKTCGACTQLYRKNNFNFRVFRSMYYCICHDKVIKKDDNGCDMWQSKKVEVDVSLSRMDKVEADVKILMEYLKDVDISIFSKGKSNYHYSE